MGPLCDYRRDKLQKQRDTHTHMSRDITRYTNYPTL